MYVGDFKALNSSADAGGVALCHTVNLLIRCNYVKRRRDCCWVFNTIASLYHTPTIAGCDVWHV